MYRITVTKQTVYLQDYTAATYSTRQGIQFESDILHNDNINMVHFDFFKHALSMSQESELLRPGPVSVKPCDQWASVALGGTQGLWSPSLPNLQAWDQCLLLSGFQHTSQKHHLVYHRTKPVHTRPTHIAHIHSAE